VFSSLDNFFGGRAIQWLLFIIDSCHFL
jgi:hypothetical protein